VCPNCCLRPDAGAKTCKLPQVAAREPLARAPQVGIHQRTNTFFVIEYHEREVSGELHEERKAVWKDGGSAPCSDTRSR